jgi:hypothetical protein
MREENRGNLYLLTGLVMGIVIGLVYAWAVRPIQYLDAGPANLKPVYKDNQRLLIAAAFAANGNQDRARARLSLLKDPDPLAALNEQAQRAIKNGSEDDVLLLGQLAVALGGALQTPVASAPRDAQPPFLPTQEAPALTGGSDGIASITLQPDQIAATGTASVLHETAAAAAATRSSASVSTETVAEVTNQTPTPQPTIIPASPTLMPSPLPTGIPSATPDMLFNLVSSEQVCETPRPEPIIQVFAQNASGEGLAGVEVVVNWQDGEEHFYTGFKPEFGSGYADFSMKPDITYNLHLIGGAEPVLDLSPFECTAPNGEETWGAWQLTYVRQ